jgi:hypothetical protein
VAVRDIPLSIYLQDALSFCEPETAGRLITDGLAMILCTRLPAPLFPDSSARLSVANELLRHREHIGVLLANAAFGNAAVGDVLDTIIIEQTELGLGHRSNYSPLVIARVALWRKVNASLFDRFQKAISLGEQRCRGERRFPLSDPFLPSVVRTLTNELSTAQGLAAARFRATRHKLSRDEMLRRFDAVSAGGACPNLAAFLDKWHTFLSSGKEGNRYLQRIVNSRRAEHPRRLRSIILAYIGLYTLQSPSYVAQALKGR